MNKKRFVIAAVMLVCLSFTACSNDIVLTEDPSLTNPINISGSAEASGTDAAEGTQLTTDKETAQTENGVSQTQTTDSTQSLESTAVTVSTTEVPPEEGQVTTVSTTVTATAPKPVITTTTTAKPAPVVTTTTTAAPPVVTTTTTAAPPVVTTTDKGVDDFVDRYNQRQQEQWEKDFAEQVFKLTNKFRAENGKPPFKKMDALNKAATTRAWEILYDYRSDHTRPDGQKFSTVFGEYGIQYHKCGENIAAGQTTPQGVMDAWINSAGHRANILSDDFTYLAVGMYYNDNDSYKYYWTQEFCCLFE
ncbi:MAG: hypothetical protein K2K41_06340 [Ruminiclostridium sp.]|nr:hypothetical protein [Ruminiclostridium sp.]